jgi:hypothetical protein
MKEGIAKSGSGIAAGTPASDDDTLGASLDAGLTAGALLLDPRVFLCSERCDAAAAAASRGFSGKSLVMAED